MTTSRWANWSTGSKKKGLSFDKFVVEAPMQTRVGPTSPAEQAHKDGLSSAGYGWWRDRTGQVVARTIAGELQYLDRKQDGAPTGQGAPTPATLDMGNPTSTASAMTPADKARSMGLQSNGSGGYVDQQGNVAARTVNNELVFYDSRAGGGAVSDGSAGALITQSSPSWVDPETGLIIVPPAQPESPEEVKATPDPVPAQMPFSYDAMMIKRKREIYAKNAREREIEQDIANQTASVEEMYASHPSLQAFHGHMQKLVGRAEESGDEIKMAVASQAKAILEDEAEIEEYQQVYNHTPEDKHEDLTKSLVSHVIKQARRRHYDSLAPGVDKEVGQKWDKSAIEYNNEWEAERQEQIQAGEYDEEEWNDYEPMSMWSEMGAYDRDERVREEMSKRGMEGYHDGSNFLGREITKIEERKAKEFKEKHTKPIKAWTEETQPELEVKGDLVTYILTPRNAGQEEARWAEGVAHGGEKEEAYKRNPWREPKNVLDVVWGVNTEDGVDVGGDETDLDEKDKKRAALESLKVWRKDILPNLEPGTILECSPTDEARARIYALAGFGFEQQDWMNLDNYDPESEDMRDLYQQSLESDPDRWTPEEHAEWERQRDRSRTGSEHAQMMGVVVVDENGNNKVLPMGADYRQYDPKTGTMRDFDEIKEGFDGYYLQMLDGTLNNEEVELVYEMLLT